MSYYDGDWDDGLYDEEYTEEDETRMRDGLRQVKERVPDWQQYFTTKDSESALWDAYYNVDKAVALLRKKFVKQATTPKPAERLLYDQPPSTEPAEQSGLKSEPQDYAIAPLRLDASPGIHFWNIPWLAVPKHREGVLAAPAQPKGGLLGGGSNGKMSKLQALAAARKKKTTVFAPTPAETLTSEMEDVTLGGAANLHTEASTTPENTTVENSPPLSLGSHKRLPIGPLQGELLTKRRRGPLGLVSPRGSGAFAMDAPRIDSKASLACRVVEPSAFAQTLCGPAFDSRPEVASDRVPLPYISSPLFNPGVFSKPSPDDVVLAAQAKAGQKGSARGKPAPAQGPAKAHPSTDSTDAVPTDKMAALKVTEQPHKGKRVDVAKLYEEQMKNAGSRRHASFVVVGHIDAGKSTTMGRLLLDLGCVDQHTIDKYRKEGALMGKQSFALAWVLDTVSEERERGVTIDIAMKDFRTAKTTFTILDAPGHRDFVPNMIAGTGRADFAIVVIDGNTGAFEKGLKGQTNEHILLLRSFGVQRLIIATNKLDMVEWSQARFDEISDQLNGYVTKIGFKAENVTFVPISGLSGDNVVTRPTTPLAAWYTGPTLSEALESAAETTSQALAKGFDRPFRLPISETYKSDKGERLLCGRLSCGTMQVGEHVAIQPSGESGHIKGITVSKEDREWAVTGENVEIALSANSSVDFERISWGDVLCPSGSLAHVGDMFTLRGLAFEHLLPMPLEVHRGRLKEDGQIVSIPALLDKATGQVARKRPKILQPGAYALIKFTVARPVVLEPGQRVVLRADGKTVAAGVLE